MWVEQIIKSLKTTPDRARVREHSTVAKQTET